MEAGTSVSVPARCMTWLSNVTFGGKDNTTLYVTARTSLYRIEMDVKGRGRTIQE